MFNRKIDVSCLFALDPSCALNSDIPTEWQTFSLAVRFEVKSYTNKSVTLSIDDYILLQMYTHIFTSIHTYACNVLEFCDFR